MSEKFTIGDPILASQMNQVWRGGTSIQGLNSGETITGATLPVPVYQNSVDSEYYACIANDTSKLNFIGFAISDGTNGNPITIQFEGIVKGFSGLTVGSRYYLTNTSGIISTTPGTNYRLVGVAISTTELLILRNKMRKVGNTSFSSTSTTTITCGFKVGTVLIYAVAYQSNESSPVSLSNGGFSNGINNCSYAVVDDNGNETTAYISTDRCWLVGYGYNPGNHNGVVQNITSTSFDLVNTKNGTTSDVYITYVAFEE